MRGKFLIGDHEGAPERYIYGDRSSLVLSWLLEIGILKAEFSIREVSRELKVSVGLVQRVFEALVRQGIVQTIGIRTRKKFILKKPQLLLTDWLKHYSIVKKCKMWTYKTGFQGRSQVLKAISESPLSNMIACTLHCAAEAFRCKNTNLETVELYMLDPKIRSKLEKTLLLEPQERGYEVLLIEPYYKCLLKEQSQQLEVPTAPLLLTFLDLYHFPLRGKEQADHLAERRDELKNIFR